MKSVLQSAAVFYFQSAKANHNPTYVSNCDVAVFNDSNHDSRLNFTFTLKKNVARMLVFISLKGQTGFNDKNFENEIFKGTIDSCSISKGMIEAIAMKAVYGHIEKYSNIAFECPQKAGDYQAYNFPMMEDNIFPTFITSMFLGRVNAQFVFKGKLLKNKPMVSLFTFDIWLSTA